MSVPDPRVFPDAGAAPPAAAALYRAAEDGLRAPTGTQAATPEAKVRAALTAALSGNGSALARLLAGAPSTDVARYLWRQLDAAWRDASCDESAALAATVFAMPIVIVMALASAGGQASVGAVLPAPAVLAAMLRENGALAGNQTLALGNALVSSDAIDLARLPEIFAWQRWPDASAAGADPPARMLLPAPLAFIAGQESVHLRFLLGSAIAKPGVDLVADPAVGRWGIPFARELSRQLAVDGVSLLALPHAPQRPLPALWQGRIARRDVAAQLFVSNALRRLRASVGEPSAVISAHRIDGVPSRGELRLSLSSPFALRGAEGFHCPLYAQDRVADVVTMLAGLLRDCRVADIRTVDGVHPDRDAATGLPLLFKPGMIPLSATVMLH